MYTTRNIQTRKKLYLLAILIIGIWYYTHEYVAVGIHKFFKKEKAYSHVADLRIIEYFSFTTSQSLKDWEEKVFKGRVKYEVVQGKDNFVRATSDSASSALYHKVKIDPLTRPLIRWKWRVKKFPIKKHPEELSVMSQDDFALRVYVIFPAAFFLNSKVLEYVWAEDVPCGTIASSPYSKNIQLFVVASGQPKSESFVEEERDIYQDYVKAFGKPPKLSIGAVAFMTDADGTFSSAEGEYADIILGYKDSKTKK